MKLLLSNNTPLSLLPTSISTSKSQSFLKQSLKGNQEPEVNGLFLVACVEDQLDLNFKVILNLQSAQELHLGNWKRDEKLAAGKICQKKEDKVG